ncbi:TPA: RelA/SpoT domain-containing protein [Vibrio cholerae]|uniref:RelA/SpoT domain-containing protein n=1 Tax=Vibrio cholerae TaxID=666 RepID=UPI000E0A214C|nr:RelA/SpoT domain-containing protein [Vibrio cholerae]EHB5529226.1 RelA/SpoT domain-containing protein [Vibrio cholerae]EHE6949611.1 RelA/SpoT domain-containing protein [Vibrio cholerae]EJL6503379.1 RelA/SpoT domain-containing protein [Vibrio cholerae]ELD8765506.1 RelA/SpoT domain-containing protein [Vibrio cholerae]ELT5929771.1 RelA/SpoT domain-containing protein [Vibrio cholerae]
MATIECKYSKKEVNRAGVTLLDINSTEHDKAKAVLDTWRACHVAPLNSFQTSLRRQLASSDDSALVSQRLKRTPSILAKLERNPQMKLSRMQDIGGIRVVVKNMQKVRELESYYKKGTTVFTVANGGKDYINYPKESGYRSVHQIFKCKNGFSIELQIRTQIQHAWATAVETMGTFLDHSLKSSEGPEKWLDFFALASSAFAILESTPRIPQFSELSDEETFLKLLQQEKDLDVLSKLSGFRVAAKHIRDDKKKGHYHLVTLDLDAMRATIQSYEPKDIHQANAQYSLKEAEVHAGKNMQVVLVTSESIAALKKAYPSYFLDAELFNRQIANVRKQLVKLQAPIKRL